MISNSGRGRDPRHYRPERQGYQLARGYLLPLPSLDEKEALALLIMARQWKGGRGSISCGTHAMEPSS